METEQEQIITDTKKDTKKDKEGDFMASVTSISFDNMT